jgi:hypothetical protein
MEVFRASTVSNHVMQCEPVTRQGDANKIATSSQRMLIASTILKSFGANAPIDLDAPQKAVSERATASSLPTMDRWRCRPFKHLA